MTTKERMTAALTSMLEDGEHLLYPIYGTLQQDERQRFAFFGLTENFLLIAFLSGKTVTATTRIPLEISSLGVQKSFFLGEHTIDISFCEGRPYRISVFPRVLTLDCQKENFPKFLSYLKRKAPAESTREHSEIKGTRIRRQYFHLLLCALLALLLPFIPMIYILECQKQDVSVLTSWSLLWSTASAALPTMAGWLSPLLLLCLCNRLFFGKTVAIVDQNGVYANGRFIKWNSVKEIIYTPTHFSKVPVHFRSAYITVTVASEGKRPFRMEVSGFPLYGLRKLKKHLPKKTVKWASDELFFAVLLAALPTAISLLLTLF